MTIDNSWPIKSMTKYYSFDYPRTFELGLVCHSGLYMSLFYLCRQPSIYSI